MSDTGAGKSGAENRGEIKIIILSATSYLSWQAAGYGGNIGAALLLCTWAVAAREGEAEGEAGCS